MKTALPLALAALVAAPVAGAAPRDQRLAEVESFAFALGSGNMNGDVAARFAPYDLVVADGGEAARDDIRTLHAGGKLVIGYLSIGTIERYRFWYRRARPYRLRDRFEEFDEHYAATSRRGFRRLILQTVAPRILRKGFDGLFLDNTDMIREHPREARGMRRLIRGIARLVHRRGAVLLAQNGEDVIGPSLRHLDGWNREDVSWSYDFARRRYFEVRAAETAAAQRALREFAARGLLVTTSDYTAAGDVAAEAEAVANSCAAGALPFVTDIRIRRISPTGYRCP